MNFSCTCRSQGSCAFIDSRAGREDVIDQENALFLDSSGVGHKKRALDVLEALFPIEPGLRLGPMLSNKRIPLNGKPYATPQGFSRQPRLIEASTTILRYSLT